MNGPQLLKWRKDHGHTLRHVAEALLAGEVTHTTIARWEGSKDDIPSWAEAKLLATTQITLPLDELHSLLDAAREDNTPAQELIARAIQEYLKKRRLTKSAEATPIPQPTEIHAAGQKLTLYSLPVPGQTSRVAEDPPTSPVTRTTIKLCKTKPTPINHDP